jgi:hypothetical protein
MKGSNMSNDSKKSEPDYNEMFHYSVETADDLLTEAKSSINLEFGQGYAEENPVLIGFFMLTAIINNSIMRIEAMSGKAENKQP